MFDLDQIPLSLQLLHLTQLCNFGMPLKHIQDIPRIFCSCDTNNEIHFWNINQYSCVRVSKGSSAQVRFQPRIGQLTDAESDRQTHSLQETLEAEMKMLRKKLTFKSNA